MSNDPTSNATPLRRGGRYLLWNLKTRNLWEVWGWIPVCEALAKDPSTQDVTGLEMYEEQLAEIRAVRTITKAQHGNNWEGEDILG